MDKDISFITPDGLHVQIIPENEKKFKRTQADTKRYLLLSFFVPCFMVLVSWIILGVHPFGDQQILVTDCWHQYFPFAKILHGKLQSFSSLFYTWESGLGSNFLAMMAYYAASPLNLLTILIPDAFLREGIAFILLLKIGFAGLFTAMFLRYTFRRNDVSVCFFAVMFALCSYILGYSWNIIWIDTVALFPLVMLGVMKLVRERKTVLYITALALSLISNYYIGLFVCIFTVIAFFCISVFECRSFRHFLYSSVRMLTSTAVGAGLGAFILIPAFFALRLTYSMNNSFPTEMSFYESWTDILANMTAFREPTVKEGLPNLYCGILCVLLLGVFLRNRHIRIREKIAAVLVLGFLILSCNMNYLNFMWHGFHFTNMLPYRFSFLFSFVMIVAAYRAYCIISDYGIKIADAAAMLVMAAGAFALTWFSEKNASPLAMWMSLLMSVFYIVVMSLYERGVILKSLMVFLTGLGLVLEMFVHTRISTDTVGTSSYSAYPAKSSQISMMLDEIDKMDEDLFSRREVNTMYSLNDPALYSYNGLSQFSSMANTGVSSFLKDLGVPASEAGNRYYYAVNSPVVNMFTGIKYIISKDGPLPDRTTLKPIGADGDVIAYENKYSLPIGFMTEKSIMQYDGSLHSNAFEAQNALFSAATGIGVPLFTPLDVTDAGHIGMKGETGVYRRGYGKYSFASDENAEEHTFRFNFVPDDDSVLYAYFWADGVKKYDILSDNVNVGSYNVTKQQGFTAPIGKFTAGTKVTISASISDENIKNGSCRIFVYKMNTDVLERGYKMLCEAKAELKEFSDTSLEADINASKDGICYFSVPYEKGWTAYIDGEKTETTKIGDAMLAVPAQKGKHSIRLEYVPEGFIPGAAITVVSAILWTVSFIMQRKTKKRKEKVKCET